MKIAIITLPLHGNYGGILQNYALQTVLKRMGYTVETIVLPWRRKQPLWRKPLAYGKRAVDKLVLHKKRRVFFERWYNRTQPALLKNMWAFVSEQISIRSVVHFADIKENDYDAFIVGSDQIWRPSYSYRPISQAYLDFSENWKNVKRLAYAVSFGTDNWEYSSRQTRKCESLVALFDGVSVREESGVNFCRERLNCEAVHVLDPTMLLSVDDYKCLFEDKSLLKPRGQLLTYILDETVEKSQVIQSVAEYYHYGIYRANSRYEDETAPLEERVQPLVEQWLKDFYDAEFVITDSFHAVVFSILFGKPFIVIGNKERGLSRIYSLLKMFGLGNHAVHTLEDLDLSFGYALDLRGIHQRLQMLRKSSMDFLYNQL